MSFRTAEPALKDVLEAIHKAETQLPDFQRGWVWDDRHIRSLIASLSLAYPIGAVMFLEAGGVPFKPRLFEGSPTYPEGGTPKPTKLVLDGQQRMTSMYLALRSGKPVKTRTEKGDDIFRVYFLDMKKCLDPTEDREEAVISVPPSLVVKSDFDRVIDLDLSTPEKQYQQRMFPTALLFETVGLMNWKQGFAAYHAGDVAASTFLMEFEYKIWMQFQTYKVPAIELSKDTPREAVCQVFEKVNTGGVTLTVFELMTATFATYEFDLRKDWELRSKRMVEDNQGQKKRRVLEGVDGTDLLTAVTLLASYARHTKAKQLETAAANQPQAAGDDKPKENKVPPVSCKRADVLRLELSEYTLYADKIEEGFRQAAELLAEEKIFDGRALPYTTQLIPLAAICALLAGTISQHGIKKKVLQWYWCGVFGEMYGGANETRFAMDLPDVTRWIGGGDEPRTVRDSGFAPRRLLSLQSRLAAAYKGLAALLMQKSARDFITGTPIDLNVYFDRAIDIHHIFPRAWCEKQNNLPREKWNSVVNKAPLQAETNRYIGGHAPSLYLTRIENYKAVSKEDLSEFLPSHLISESHLRSDDFHGFLRNRANQLLDLIQGSTGKVISGRDSEETVDAFGGPLGTPPESNETPEIPETPEASLAEIPVVEG